MQTKPSTMKNIFHKKNWNQGAVEIHVETPPILLIKGDNNTKMDKYCIKIELRRDPTA